MKTCLLFCCLALSTLVFGQFKVVPLDSSRYQLLVDMKDESSLIKVGFPEVYALTPEYGVIFLDSVFWGIVDTVVVKDDDQINPQGDFRDKAIIEAYFNGKYLAASYVEVVYDKGVITWKKIDHLSSPLWLLGLAGWGFMIYYAFKKKKNSKEG